MFFSRSKSKYNQLCAIYLAIHNDDAEALRNALPSSFKINKLIYVQNSNFQPLNVDTYKADISKAPQKTLIEIAAAKGRIKCVEWLLQQPGIDKTPLLSYAVCQEPKYAGLERFCDTKSNYQMVGQIAITELRRATTDQRNKEKAALDSRR